MKSEFHYHNFISAVKSKYKRLASEKAEGDEENAKRSKMETEEGAETKDESIEADVSAGNEGDGKFISNFFATYYYIIIIYM